MRKSPAIDVLFPAVRQEVLATALMQPQRWWYLSDLAMHLGRSPSSLQRELSQLADAGILETRREANRTYYRANAACPLLPELTGLIAKTVGVADIVRHSLRSVAKHIDWAFIYGSLARGEEVADSDVDIFVIGEAKLADLARPLKNAEKQLGRPVNPSVFPRTEFLAKLRSGQHFVRAVVAGDKLFLMGEPREFAKATQSEATPSTQNEPQRAR
jgi:predicted nucleotidyltransferase